MDYTDDTDSQDMGCAQIKSVESVESVGHEGCWGTLKPTDDTDDTDVRRRTGGLGIGMCRTGVVLGEWICEECVFLRLWCGAWLGTRLFLPSSLWVAVGWGVRITNLILQL